MLLNMGGASNLFEVEIFLKNLFSDPHILQIKNNFLRKIVGNFIANKRLVEAKKNYQAIGGGSPIARHTFALTQKLKSLDTNTFYTYAMRYTPPYSSMVIDELISQEITSVTLFSMYPQYSTTTTLSSLQDFQTQCQQKQYTPTIQIIDRYYKHPLFIQAITQQILHTLSDKNPQDYTLLLSAHGLPQSIIDAGDPYQHECEQTCQALQNHLALQGIVFKEIKLSYQSKMGPMKWLEPSTKNTIKKLKNQNVIIYPLTFTIDNSETLYELAIELRQIFAQSGGNDFLLCPCFNDNDLFAKLIINLTQGGQHD
nr:ferrochelatase [Helicobacter enhydrae]